MTADLEDPKDPAPVTVSKPAVMPGNVLIGTVNYLVTNAPGEWMRKEQELQRKGDYGHIDHTTAMIYINPDASPDVARLTLWHEVMHGLCESLMGSPSWRGLGNEKDDREEAVVRALESPTLLVLRDNPDLAIYLLT